MVHRRVRVGDEVRVTAGVYEGKVGVVVRVRPDNAATVYLPGEGHPAIPRSRLEPTQPRQRPGEKSEDIVARLAAKRATRPDDPTDPANLTPLMSDLGEKPPRLVAVPPQARTSSLAEWDRAESNGVRIGRNRAVAAIQRTLAAETRRIRERGISETDEAYLEGIERALDVVREMGSE
jgi:hypothetical protein